MENTTIGKCNTDERQQKENRSAHKHGVLIDPGVNAGQSQHGWDITEEMINGPRFAIRIWKTYMVWAQELIESVIHDPIIINTHTFLLILME